MKKTYIKYAVIGIVALFVLIQLVPYGRNHDNPAVVLEPNWDSPQTRQLAERACFDCHSNESKWPWYSNVAPVSWFIYSHVEDGRRHLNFSDWGNHSRRRPKSQAEIAKEIDEVIREGEMPLSSYLPLHPEAKLSNAEIEQLIEGLVATVNNSPQ